MVYTYTPSKFCLLHFPTYFVKVVRRWSPPPAGLTETTEVSMSTPAEPRSCAPSQQTGPRLPSQRGPCQAKVSPFSTHSHTHSPNTSKSLHIVHSFLATGRKRNRHWPIQKTKTINWLDPENKLFHSVFLKNMIYFKQYNSSWKVYIVQ